jgi:hypothetical protein
MKKKKRRRRKRRRGAPVPGSDFRGHHGLKSVRLTLE